MIILIFSAVTGYCVCETYRYLIKRKGVDRVDIFLFILPFIQFFLIALILFSLYIFRDSTPFVHRNDVIRFASGFILGYLTCLFYRRRMMSVQNTIILFIIFIVGAGPSYWKYWIETLDIQAIPSIIEFRNVDYSIQAQHETRLPPQEDTMLAPSDDTTVSSNEDLNDWIIRFIEVSILFDNEYEARFRVSDGNTASSQSHNITVIQRVLTNSMAFLVRHAGMHFCVASQPEQNIASQILYDTASEFSSLMYEREDGAGSSRFIAELEAAHEKLNELRRQSRYHAESDYFEQNCSKYDADEDEPLKASSTDVSQFLELSRSYPYFAVALARVMAEIGHEKEGVEGLKKWIDEYGHNIDPIYLVRAYSALDGLESKYGVLEASLKQKDFGHLQLAFIEAIGRVVASIETSKFVTKTPECERLPKDWQTDVYLQLEIGIKNNFDWWAAENYVQEFALEALGYSEEIKAYNIRYCAEVLDSPAQRHIHRAYYYDTYASAILTFRGEQYKSKSLKHSEFCDALHSGIAAWEEAEWSLSEVERPMSDGPKTKELKDVRELIKIVKRKLNVWRPQVLRLACSEG